MTSLTITKTITYENWRGFAKCAGDDEQSELFFDPDESTRQAATSFCHSCPVKFECLAEALDSMGSGKRQVWGVWGGMTERERTYYRRRNKIPSGHKTWVDYARAVREVANA